MILNDTYLTKSKKETIELGKNVIQSCLENDLNLIILKGEFGTGKTTFTKGIAEGLGVKNQIKSPSFNKKYQYKNIIHYDLYNVRNSELMMYKNQILEDLEFNNVIIEWGDNILGKKYNKFFPRYLKVEISTLGGNDRKFAFKIIENKK